MSQFDIKKQPIETAFETYKYIESIGSGGSGNVIKIKDNFGNTYALKYLDIQNLNSEKLKRFKNEISFCYKNKHKNIINVLDWVYFLTQNNKCPFYIMPYYDKTFRKIMMDKSLSWNIKLSYYSQILDGVEAAHLQHVWHRDLKPENILVDSISGTIVIADFGIAHICEELHYTSIETSPHSRLANFQYAAPEQRERGRCVDHRADIYALGMMLNELFTGALPLGTDFKKIGSKFPQYEYLDEIVESMLKQTPEQRPNSIDVIKKEFIAREKEFVSRQKLSELRGTVIPSSEIDDQLVLNPIKLVSVDYLNGNLVFELNQPVNSNWEKSFHNIGEYSSILGKEPENFIFENNKAIIACEENNAQKLLDYFKDYIQKANSNYVAVLQRKRAQEEKEKKEMLQKRIDDEEIRNRILNNLKL